MGLVLVSVGFKILMHENCSYNKSH